MYSILILLMTISLSISAPFSSFDLKRPTDTTADEKLIPETTGKLLTIVKKNLKPNKQETTLLVSEELVFSSTGYPTFDAFDQNSDGFIEFEEFAATDGKDHKTNFIRADTNGDQKLSPEEFSQLSVVVYEPEQFSDSDSDSDEPSVVFLTPPESITRFTEKDTKPESEQNFDDYKDIPVFVSTIKEDTKDDKDLSEDNGNKKEDNLDENKQQIKTETEKPVNKSEKTEITEAKDSEDKSKEGSHFTAEDMPVKIDDEDDEEMIDVKDEDIPMEMIDDLNDDNHYDLDEIKEPQEDDKKMNDQLNSIE